MKLYLEDLEEMTQKEVKNHLVENYAEESIGFGYGEPNEEDKIKLKKILKNFKVIIAYESVGSYGCDSSSFFLIERKQDKALFEIHGSHCSCYGFEGQFEPEETSKQYLKSNNFNFNCGGYDNNENKNKKLVKEFLQKI